MRRTPLARALALSILPLLAMLALAVIAPAEGRAKGKRVVLSPRAGQVVHANQVRIRVRSSDSPGDPRVRLNGVQLGADFSAPRGGVRALRASRSHGLRRGTNVLRVTVRRSGGAARRATVRFVVQTQGRLVGAGRDRRVAIGSLVSLRGAVTNLASGSKTRWKLVDGPRRGRAHGALARLTSPTGINAGFRPRVPGSYTLRLTAGSGGTARSDAVTFDAVPRSLLVDVDTMVRPGGQPGIEVGDTTYAAPAPAGNPSAFVQVLVLERDSLGFQSNTTYTDADRLADALRRLDDTSLVIAVLQKPSTPGTEPLRGQSLVQALAPIGFPNLRAVPQEGGSLSAIGVPKTEPGDADVRVDASGGDMTGYLTPDQHLEYGFVSPDRALFAVPEQFQDGTGVGGFEVVRYEAHDLNKVDIRVFKTGAEGLSRNDQALEARAMAAYLRGLPAGDVVEIRADAQNPGHRDYQPPVGRLHGDYLRELADAIVRVGGSRNGFYRAVQQYGPENGKPVYALLGWAGAGEGEGVEAAMYVNATPDSPVPTGELRRDRQSMWKPAQTSLSGRMSDTLERLVMAEPGAERWPLAGDADAQKALAYLGNKQGQLGPDPRSAYWTQNFDQAQWQGVAKDVEGISYPGGHDFTEDQFNKVKTQLLQELRWVGRVRGYLTTLSSPFWEGIFEDWSKSQTIADRIYKEARSPKDETAMRWIEFTRIMLELASPLTGHATSEVAAILDFGVWLAGANADGEPGYEDLHITADELGSKLIEQAVASRATFKRIGDVIVSDYHKLSVVGSNAFCNSDDCNKDFAFTDADQELAATVASRGVERILYEKLLPIGFHYFQLNQFVWNDMHDLDPHDYVCRGIYHPWYGFPALASTSLLGYLDLQQNFYGQDVFVLGAPAERESDQHSTPPSDKTLERVFGPVSSSKDPDAGGLGVSAAELVLKSERYGWEDNGPGNDGSLCMW
jgi:hypothetical protein